MTTPGMLIGNGYIDPAGITEESAPYVLGPADRVPPPVGQPALDPDQQTQPAGRIAAPITLDPGGYDAANESNDAGMWVPPDDRDRDVVTNYTPPRPLGMIGVLPIAGIVVDAGQIVYDGVTDKRASIGSGHESRPGALQIILRVSNSAGAGVASVVPDYQQDTSRTGFTLTASPIALPLRRANLWLTGGAAVTVDYMIVMNDTGLQ